MQVFFKTAYSSQTILIGKYLCISENRIGYLNLAFAVKKGQKRSIFTFQPLKCLDELKIQSWSINLKKFLPKNP